ncbi:hypothetical protein MMC26_000895 [Xylographa opegraphella]|nr:hypothetical protein [Xylographa opegraphella]
MSFRFQDSPSAIFVLSFDEDITDYQAALDCDHDAYELMEFLSRPSSCASLPHTEPNDIFSISDSTLLIGNGRDVNNTNIELSLREKARSPIHRHISGWRRGVSTAAITTSLVLCINIGLAIWAATRTGTQDGIGILYEGICSNSSQINTGLHLAINILSTLLLGAGNYTMQCLSAPTRAEVDHAHRQGLWLDIGVSSVRNIFRIGRGRAVLWVLLGLSSLPLHLLYNSTIHQTIVANQYIVFVISEDFLNGAAFNVSSCVAHDPQYTFTTSKADYITEYNSVLQNLQLQDVSSIQNLSNEACIAAYGGSFVTNRGHVFAVSPKEDPPGNNSLLTVFFPPLIKVQSYEGNWVCTSSAAYPASRCDVGTSKPDPSNWKFVGHPIAYCLSQQAEEICRFEFSMQLLLAVILCNLITAICMAVTILQQKEPTLVTIGDAISSFLDAPDPTTIKNCMMSRADVVRGRWGRQKRFPCEQIRSQSPLRRAWSAKSQRWFSAASGRRWLVCISLCSIALVAAAVLLWMSVTATRSDISTVDMKTLWNLGFGAVNGQLLLDPYEQAPGAGSLIPNVLVANFPQVIFSCLDLMYNSLYTCMLLGHEWTNYAYQGKSLRVTSPAGEQRSSYWLQLPYTYSIPLMVLSGLMHWLISQSLFLARIGEKDSQGDIVVTESTCGYSPIAIIFSIMVGSLMVIGLILNGFRRYRPGVPLAPSCSAAISAACHPADDGNAARSRVRWGEVNAPTTDGLGHCTFTSDLDVRMPTPGRLYE